HGRQRLARPRARRRLWPRSARAGLHPAPGWAGPRCTAAGRTAPQWPAVRSKVCRSDRRPCGLRCICLRLHLILPPARSQRHTKLEQHMHVRKILIMFAVIVSALLPAAAQANKITDAIQKRYDSLSSFQTDFQQELTNAASGSVEKRSGKIWFKQSL